VLAGSVSLRLYPHLDLPAPGIVDVLRAQARLASESGFAGVMTSEHHGGFAGYLPNPLQAAGWCLEAMPSGWAAACPLLLPLRPAALVAEEVAWLAARFPGRVALGVAAGALPSDFEVMDVPMAGLTDRFAAGLTTITDLLAGRGDRGVLAGDPALARCAEHPVPVLSAAMGFTAVRRAAGAGAGLLFDSLSPVDKVRRLTDAYRDAGGTEACVLIRRAWVGEPPTELFGRQVGVYRSYTPESAQSQWGNDEMIVDTDPAAVAERLHEVAGRAGADALNLRIHVPGLSPALARAQIPALGTAISGRTWGRSEP
jgi:alkanesulfonate monooxygenase SsuD/methylene tetrahydromethanopterin reductase-like flavin-dependent oxidoreductase (luciferase family)